MHEINLDNIQLQDFELFLAVAEYGSFTKAGEKLFVTQSWVSKRMNLLESELGLQLFIRSRNHMGLTPAGEYLRGRLLFAQNYLRESIQEANRIQTGISGAIRIGILEWATNGLLLPLQEFVKNNPQISVDIHCQQFQEMRQHLRQGNTDLIFTLEYDNISFLKTEISSTRLCPAQMMAYMNREHPLAKKDSISVRDLQSEEMLLLYDHSSSGYNEFVNRLFRQEKIRPLVSQYAASGRAHLVNLIFGRGILIASNFFLGDEYQDQIRAVPIDGVQTYITAVWKQDNANPVIPMLLQVLMSQGDGKVSR